MTTWEQEIEQDLAWREAEMASLKLLLVSSSKGSDRHKALLRACSAMLYAHYEGFCKFCWTLLLGTIEAQAHLRQDLCEPIARRAMSADFKRLRGDTSDKNLWQFATRDFATALKLAATFAEGVSTDSNLKPALAKQINESVGLVCGTFDTHGTELGQLVGRRNEIAHGEKLEIADVTQFQQFEHAAVLAMHELAIAVLQCLEQKTYLAALHDPAALI